MPELNPTPSSWPGNGRIVIAFSGGPDSLYLLYQVLAFDIHRAVVCLHIDHGLDVGSADRARRAVQLARAAGCDCTVVRAEVKPGGSPEAMARNARYQAISDFMCAGDVVLTAHHVDDQLETVIMRLLRGAGPTGLAGIPRQRRYHAGWLIRPLLDCTRAEIETWIEKQGLSPVFDPANDSPAFDRNFVRRELMPLIRRRWGGAQRSILRSARLCRGAATTLEQVTVTDLAGQSESPRCLRLVGTLAWSDHRLGEMLRLWCHRQHLPAPPGRRVEAFIQQLRDASPDQQPELRWNNSVIRSWRQRLWLETLTACPAHWQLEWLRGHTLELPGDIGQLELVGIDRPPTGLRVSAGTDAEKLRPAGRQHRHNVRQLMAEAGVPPWQRSLWPRLWLDDRLVGIADRWHDEELSALLDSAGARLVWHTRLHSGC